MVIVDVNLKEYRFKYVIQLNPFFFYDILPQGLLEDGTSNYPEHLVRSI